MNFQTRPSTYEGLTALISNTWTAGKHGLCIDDNVRVFVDLVRDESPLHRSSWEAINRGGPQVPWYVLLGYVPFLRPEPSGVLGNFKILGPPVIVGSRFPKPVFRGNRIYLEERLCRVQDLGNNSYRLTFQHRIRIASSRGQAMRVRMRWRYESLQ